MWLVKDETGVLRAFHSEPHKVEDDWESETDAEGFDMPSWFFSHIPEGQYVEPEEVRMEFDPEGKLWAHRSSGQMQERDEARNSWYVPRWVFDDLSSDIGSSFLVRIVPKLVFTSF